MNIYAIKFREKDSKEYLSAIFQAIDATDLNLQVENFIKNGDFDIDRRTISWTGGSIPLHSDFSKPLIIYTNLDNHT